MTEAMRALAALLQQQLDMLDKSTSHLQYSYKKIVKMDFEQELSNNDLEILDSYGSRFMRTYEVLVNQVIRTTLRIVNEYKLTYLDNMNVAEKIGLIVSTDALEETRKLRNMIGHEYILEEWLDIYRDLIVSTMDLLESCEMTKRYIDTHNLLFLD